MNYIYLKIPRFDGRKTLTFNAVVIIMASVAHIWLVAGRGFEMDSRTWLLLLGLVAGCNGLLRLVTERPVWWRQMRWLGVDLAGEGEERTVYHHAAEFVQRSDFTDIRESEAARRIQPYSDFQQDLDARLSQCHAFSNGRQAPMPELPELPLDEESERH
jgi:hypothetical protein